MRRMHILLACLLSGALLSPAPARPSRKPVPQRPAQPVGQPLTYSSSTLEQQVAKLTIAGIAWGQRDAVVQAKLREGGFTITSDEHEDHRTFDQQVERGTMDYPYKIRAEKPNEEITVEMWVAPDGWRVSRITYVYTGGLAPRQLEQAAIQKYQSLGFKIGGQSGWNIAYLPSAKHWSELPHITIDPFNGQFSLRLEGGYSGTAAFEKPFEDAVAKRKGLTKPTF